MQPQARIALGVSVVVVVASLCVTACTSIPDAATVLRNPGGTGPGGTTPACAPGDDRTAACDDSLAAANKIAFGDSMTGTIDARPNGAVDRDVFRFEALSGDLVQIKVARTAGSTLQPYFVLFNADGDRYHNGPLTGAAGVARGQYFVDVGGTFYVEVSDLRHHSTPFQPVGGADLGYRIDLRNVPLADARPVLPPFSTSVLTLPEQRVLPKYKFEVDRGTRIVAEVTALRLSPPSQLDTVLRLINISTSPPQVVWDPLESTCRHASLSIL